MEERSNALEPDDALAFMRPTALRRLQGIAAATAHEMMASEVVQLHKRVFALHSYSTGYTDQPRRASVRGGLGLGGSVAPASPHTAAAAAAKVAVALRESSAKGRGGRGGRRGAADAKESGSGSGSGAPEKPSRRGVGWLRRRRENAAAAAASAAAHALVASDAKASEFAGLEGAGSGAVSAVRATGVREAAREAAMPGAAARNSASFADSTRTCEAVAAPSLPNAAERTVDTRTATELLLDEIAAATQSATTINTGGGIMLLREAGALTRRIFKQVWERICEHGVAFLVHAVGSPLNAAVATDAVYV